MCACVECVCVCVWSVCVHVWSVYVRVCACVCARVWSVCVCARVHMRGHGHYRAVAGTQGPRRYRNAVDPQPSPTLFLFSVKCFPFHCSFASTSWSVSDQVAGLCPQTNRQQV